MKRVQFNDDLENLHKELVDKNVTSQTFEDFARDAFHDKVDELRSRAQLDLSHETIEKITQEVIARLPQKVQA